MYEKASDQLVFSIIGRRLNPAQDHIATISPESSIGLVACFIYMKHSVLS
jgi:hypothetical protein